MPRLLSFLLACACATALTACGGDSQPAAEQATTTAQPSSATPEPAQAKAGEGAGQTVAGIEITGAENLDAEPTVTVPADAKPPSRLVSRDLVKGSGPRIAAGDQASVQYTGVSWSTGEKFDASWDRGAEPFTFPVGAHNVIAGWDEGVVGMRVGGRRLLIIPPDLGYGPDGQPPVIAPNETLVFVVDAVAKQ